MRVIDILNKIANGEEVPKKIRIDHSCYEFEWDETAGNYIDKKQDIDLMSCLSMDEEELNYEIHELKEDKKIAKLDLDWAEVFNFKEQAQQDCVKMVFNKINEIIEVINERTI